MEMKEEVDAAADFLSRIFLTDNVAKEKILEFTTQLADVLQERFRDHWHESCPTKGQAYRCIRICPEENLDPLLERVCNQVGINVNDFNLPMELTLWVDPKEVTCKFGDLKCSYHTVAKKDINSGVLDNKTESLDIKDMIENARDLYMKKQTVVVHPINSSEMHIQNPYGDGSPNGFTMAVRINGQNRHALSCSPPLNSLDGSPRSKGKLAHHSPHGKRGGGGLSNGHFHYYGKASGGKGSYLVNGHVSNSHHANGNGTGGGGFHRAHPHQHQPHHQQQHHHHHPSHPNHQHMSAYQNGYLNSYHEENGYSTATAYDQRSVSPSKMNGGTNGLPPLSSLSQGSPTPEQIQQQMQHPPPIPPPMPPHLHQPFVPHHPADPSIPPPITPTGAPPPPQQQQQQMTTTPSTNSTTTASSSSIASTITSNNTTTTTVNNNSSNTNNSNNNNPGKLSSNSTSQQQMSGSNNKFPGNRMGGNRGNGRQSSPVKEVK